MANLDWIKIKQALLSHEWIALLVLAYLLSIPLYIILQIWFGYAWGGRWRIAALIPLIGLALTLIFLIGLSYYPDLFGPPIENPLLDYPILTVMLFSPAGFIYLVIAGIAHGARGSRPRPDLGARA